ncbi:response regulator [Candidatus Magnetominusculus dajiuhuensis]|uniref:response regulator n=1 Tax=Candidatus Magnetominusculus dajiuhuensis TaxID=3137712 RepID=UPI003B435675
MPQTKLLIIDDEEDYASALAERLNLRNFEAAAVYEAKEALAAVEINHPDVILLDLCMPGMEAKDMIKAIKSVAPEVEIIIVSGHALPAAEIKQTALVKPIEIKELIEKINKAVLKKQGAL